MGVASRVRGVVVWGRGGTGQGGIVGWSEKGRGQTGFGRAGWAWSAIRGVVLDGAWSDKAE